jgi:hypothetical protein
VGQLGESGEYQMGRSESDLFLYSLLQSGSPHLCRLRTMSVGPPAISIDYVLTHTGYMGPHKLIASMIAELDDTLHRFMND